MLGQMKQAKTLFDDLLEFTETNIDDENGKNTYFLALSYFLKMKTMNKKLLMVNNVLHLYFYYYELYIQNCLLCQQKPNRLKIS